MTTLPKPCDGYFWFDIDYRMDDGTRWGVYILAQSHEEAETRLRCIKDNGTVVGRVVKQIPMGDGDIGDITKKLEG